VRRGRQRRIAAMVDNTDIANSGFMPADGWDKPL
jgi:hypothetical protein